MEKPEDFGTDEKGFHVNDFCRYCFQGGQFTEPDLTQEEMIKKVSGMLVEKAGMTAEEAKKMAEDFVPKLKRWSADCCGCC